MDPQVRQLLDDQVLDQVRMRYGLAPTALHPLGSFTNLVYSFRRKGQSYILRLVHSSQRPLEQIQGEVDWIEYLAGHGVPAARAVPAAGGRMVEVLATGESYFSAVAFERAPGRFVRRSEWQPGLFARIGRLVGRMHALAKSYLPSVPAWKRRDWYEESIAFAEGLHLPPAEQGTIDRFMALVAQLRTLPADRDSYGLVHTDVHDGNFFLDGDRITLFDFDNCQYSWFVDDIAMAVFYAVSPGGAPARRQAQAETFLSSFLKGYIQENTLDPAWFQQLPHFFKARELAVYAAAYADCGGDIGALRDWPARFMRGRRERIAAGAPYVDLDMEKVWRGMGNAASTDRVCQPSR